MRTAFYPCCAYDTIEPVALLADYVDRIVFCDLKKNLWTKRQPTKYESEGLICEFVVGDAREVIKELTCVDVLFYRRDSTGEGGSALFVLGDVFLRPFMERFSPNGGYIITDGSNSRGGNFKRMIRKNGLVKFNHQFKPTDEQPYLSNLNLRRIMVSQQISTGNLD